MRTSGWLVIAAAAFVALAAPSAHADDGDAPPQQTPFDRGRFGFGASLGEQSQFGQNYFVVGAGISYYLLDGFSIGLSGLHEFGGPPSINQLSPSIQYVAKPLVGHWPVFPYVGGFYDHWFLGDGVPDVDTVGARAGLMMIQNHVVIGLGIAYEHTVSACPSDCDTVYPDLSFGFSL